MNGNDFYVGNGSCQLSQIARLNQIPAAYTHPTNKQCNYAYTHPTGKQCSWTPDLSNYATKSDLQSASRTNWVTLGTLTFNNRYLGESYRSNSISINNIDYNTIRAYVSSYYMSTPTGVYSANVYLGIYLNGEEEYCLLKTGKISANVAPSFGYVFNKQNAKIFSSIGTDTFKSNRMLYQLFRTGSAAGLTNNLYFMIGESDSPSMSDEVIQWKSSFNSSTAPTFNVTITVEATNLFE